MQRRLVVSYRRFGTTYRSHLYLEDGASSSSRNIDNYQSTLLNIPEELIPLLKIMVYSLYILAFNYCIVKQNTEFGRKSFERHANAR